MASWEKLVNYLDLDEVSAAAWTFQEKEIVYAKVQKRERV